MTNSVQKGEVRVVAFKKRGIWHAVALEFNIVETGKSFDQVWISLHRAMGGYLEAIRKANIRPFPLNQTPLKEYSDIWKAEPGKKKSNVPSPFYRGTLNLAAYA